MILASTITNLFNLDIKFNNTLIVLFSLIVHLVRQPQPHLKQLNTVPAKLKTYDVF